MIKTPHQIINDCKADLPEDFYSPARGITYFKEGFVSEVMNRFANQFKYIQTTCGKRVICDDQDYDFLKSLFLFVINDRGIVCHLVTKEGEKRKTVPIAKTLLSAPDKSVIHYKDGNFFNISRANIFIKEKQQAHFGQKKPTNNTSGYKGVSWNKNAKKYGASIRVDGNSKHLGYFGDVHAAAIAYNEAAKTHFGAEYAHLNKIETLNKHGE